ncbi:AraC family transcriptional regulator [uncultured Victivallis sp.]|uniref:helix-turn-helix domain-containing protein n=1 Tax=uncultured Victivallis sp. TaxID=354118 RepID=UPI0025F4C580|nr:AraC family transcriptional regulator [uncultured Victivallis sp.]
MSNDKIIQFDFSSERPDVHRLLRKMPELHARYGLWIINAGAASRSAENGFVSCRPRKFEFYSISHLIEGAGRCWIDGCGEWDVSPGQLITVAPGVLNRYGGAAGLPYVEDSIRFTGPIADMLYQSGILQNGVADFGSARKLLPIMAMIQDPSRDAQFNANIMLQKLLVDLYLERNRTLSVTPVEALLEAIKSRPEHWWTVEEMAEFCNLSVDQFRRNFERRTGMRPKRYLEEFKLRLAAEFLVSGSAPVAEIALRLGYRDPYHFSRRFKLFAGVSPERYRREFPNFTAPSGN